MRVLLLNHFPLTGSGSGVYTLTVANSLMRQGHEVCCIFPENQAPEKYDFKTHPVYFTNTEDGKNIRPKEGGEGVLDYNFPCFTTHPRSTMTFEALSDEQEKTYYDAFRAAIQEEVENFKPDVIHAGHIWILPYIASQYNLPLIITAHGTDIMGFHESDRYREVARKAAHKADGIIAISEKNYDLAVEAFPESKKKIKLISNGYDSQVFYIEDSTNKEKAKQAVLESLSLPTHYKHIVSFAGKLTDFKGVDILIRAAAKYARSDTATLIAGDGQLFDELNKLAYEELQLKDIYFLHNQPHEVLRHIYNVADVSCVPSRNEPFGLVVLEAGACGAPVIGTNDGGIADILVEDTGVLINPEDYNALAENVSKIIEGNFTFNREHISAYTKKYFSIDASIGKVIELYNTAQSNY